MTQEGATYEPKSRLLPDSNVASALILGFPALKLREIISYGTHISSHGMLEVK